MLNASPQAPRGGGGSDASVRCFGTNGMSVAMALAEKLHHSAYRSVPLKEEWVEHEKYDALRGQKTASGREATNYTSKASVAGGHGVLLAVR